MKNRKINGIIIIDIEIYMNIVYNFMIRNWQILILM